MSEPTHVQEYGNLRAVLNSDGRKALFLPTGGNLWISARAPYPEIDVPRYHKEVLNPNIGILNGNNHVVWAVTIDDHIIIGVNHVSGLSRRVYYSTNEGATWTVATKDGSPFTQNAWAKVINGKLYVGSTLNVSVDKGETFQSAGVDSMNVDSVAGSSTTVIGIGGRLRDPFDVDSIVADAVRSTDGVTFSIVGHAINHIGDGLNRANSWDVGQRTGIEYQPGVGWSGYNIRHTHRRDSSEPPTPDPDPFPYPYGAVAFTSGGGGAWGEVVFAGYNNGVTDDNYWGMQGPFFVVDGYMITTPNNRGRFYYRTPSGGWDVEIQTELPLNPISSSDRDTTADTVVQWMNKAYDRYWVGNNYDPDWVDIFNYRNYNRSELCVSNSAGIWLPVPVLSEEDYFIEAKCVDEEGSLLVFERRTNATSTSPFTTTRLVKVVED